MYALSLKSEFHPCLTKKMAAYNHVPIQARIQRVRAFPIPTFPLSMVQASVAIVVHTSILCQVHWQHMHAGYVCLQNMHGLPDELQTTCWLMAWWIGINKYPYMCTTECSDRWSFNMTE